jgi:epoxyqueuosine reductase QueG
MNTQTDNLTGFIMDELLRLGADLVGVGDLAEVPAEVRANLPIGICVAVKYPDAVIRGIADLPTKAYNSWYNRLNQRLDMLVASGAEALQTQGYAALAMTRAQVGNGETDNNTALPHKTVATRAGIGWIGKSALLVTEKYGSMVRISSILTDAPLKTTAPINQSRCGNCMVCTRSCPAGAISGKAWEVGVYHDEFFDPAGCRRTARERAFRGFGGGNTICGKCIEVCPYTRRAWK